MAPDANFLRGKRRSTTAALVDYLLQRKSLARGGEQMEMRRLSARLRRMWLMIPLTAFAGEPALPEPVPVSETVQDVEMVDPYRWMEKGGPRFDAWAKAEADHARSTLDTLPGREGLQRRIASLDSPSLGVRDLQVRANRWLYRRAASGSDKITMFARRGRDGVEQQVDLLGLLPKGEGTWSEVAAARVLSPDGRYLTFGTTVNGESTPTLRVYDLATNRLLPDEVVWPLWADSNGFRPRWLVDGSGFFYVRRPDADALMDDTQRARKGQIFLHRLGSPVSEDRAVFGHGLTEGITETDTLYVQGEPDPRWLDVLRRMPSGRELWVIDLAGLEATGLPRARRVYTSDVLSAASGIHDDHLYTLDAAVSRFRVLRFDLRQQKPAPIVALPEQEGVLRRLVSSRDGVYVTENLLSKNRLHVIGPSGARAMALPEGAVDTLATGVEGRGAWVEMVDWLAPQRGGLVESETAAFRELSFGSGAAERAPVSAFASRVEWATARDGERIPYTILEPIGAKRVGNAYVMMNGYGCFGAVNDPFHWPALEAWLERGGVFVVPGLRGGGELGADWHRAGRDRNKPAAFEDAIDVAKHLVREGVSRPGKIGVTGGSCGGMTMGMAALEAPHLIGAARLTVGAFDLWRMAGLSAAGARSIRDVGDPDTSEGVRRILATSPYMQLLDGAPRPAFLIGSGATDYTIPLWVGGKMVARARAALPQGKPVLWSIDWTAGHSAGVDYVKQDTDLMSFLFWQLGHADFQPESSRR